MGVSFLLEPSYIKFLDFQIVFDDNQYWIINCEFNRQKERCEMLTNYPLNCSHFVKSVRYGVELCVILPKIGFTEDKNKVRVLNFS